MVSRYEDLSCDGCGGELQPTEKQSVWECIYCGKIFRKVLGNDTSYKIENVVKQVLLDLAYDRLESAEKNLLECQKMNPDNVGTLIAEISLKTYWMMTSGTQRNGYFRSAEKQVKKLCDKLEKENNFGDFGVSSEAELLYESFNGESDALGILLLVYDKTCVWQHLNYVLKLFDASSVYSVVLAEKLLKYALNNNKKEIVEGILMNADDINCREALFDFLSLYDDSEKKRQLINTLMSRAEFKGDDFQYIRNYLINTTDSVATKVLVYKNAVYYKIAPPMRCVVDYILSDPSLTDMQISEVYKAFCSTKPRDSELYDVIEDIYSKHSGKMANIEMQELISDGIFIKLTNKVVKAMINRKDLSVDERVGLLDKAEKCRLNKRDNDAIISALLMNNDESFETRIKLARKITEYVDSISTKVLTKYIVDSTIDGNRKPEMLEELFKLNLIKSSYRDVLNQYIESSKDSFETKKAVSQFLNNQSICMDSSMLLEMACAATKDDYLDRVAFIQKSIQNGTRINANNLSQYLERVMPEEYHSELISLMTTPASRVTDKALANYVLYSDEGIETKLHNALFFSEKNGKPFGESVCEVKHLDALIRCNLFQGYVLVTEDSAALAEAMTNAMKDAKSKLTSIIYVDGQGQKFKKYISDKKAQLSPLSLALCEENKAFSRFF